MFAVVWLMICNGKQFPRARNLAGSQSMFAALKVSKPLADHIPYNDEIESRMETRDSPPSPRLPQILFYSLPPKVGTKLEKEVRSRLEWTARKNAHTLWSILYDSRMSLGSSSNASIANGMIEQQSRLAEMSKWGQPQSEAAQSLVSAMLQIRDLMQDPENTLLKNLP